MGKLEFLLKASREGREWLQPFLPFLLGWLGGWHAPQPKWMKKGKGNVGNDP